MSANSKQAQSLLAAGLRDRLTLCLLRDAGEAPQEVMGFHAQQACEKFIKAVLVVHGVVFEPTHDLAVLVALCADHQIQVPSETDALRILNNLASIIVPASGHRVESKASALVLSIQG
ncbi:HEPN domain-containing protein [uncultured Thiodictyon sp.]|uniref:HEPN domain-containing protein n=1 Tax=uncultured Thiodictyon sp. TaxID=1846217 RepID=UPI0025E6EA54|nr:HEPN domain-containing protein [uncultured Thiodictyon sp.]